MRNRDIFFVVLGCVQILTGIGIAASNLSLIPIADGNVDWIAVDGQITSSQVVTGEVGDYGDEVFCGPEVQYTYRVQGQEYTGSLISFNSGESCSGNKAEQYDPRYAIGSQVVVYYDPQKPNSAVLEPGPCGDCYVNLAGAVAFVIIGFLVLRNGFSGAHQDR